VKKLILREVIYNNDGAGLIQGEQEITPEKLLEIYGRADEIRNERWSMGVINLITPADIRAALEELK